MKYSFNIFVFSQTQVSSMVFDFFFFFLVFDFLYFFLVSKVFLLSLIEVTLKLGTLVLFSKLSQKGFDVQNIFKNLILLFRV